MNTKRIFNLGMVLMLLVTSFAVSQPVGAQGPAKIKPSIIAGAQVVPGEVVVAFADSEGKNLVEKIEQAVETANEADGEVTRLSVDGSAVIRVDGDAAAAAAELNNQADVLYAEPNYIYSVPPEAQAAEEGYKPSSDYVFRSVTPSANTNWKSIMAVPRSTIEGMVAMGTYPTDTYLNDNQGWFETGADIVWPNPTPSANICQIDTGVDMVHPDLSYVYSYTYTYKSGRKWKTGIAYATAYRVYPGYDFVNADANPSDDNGHGTHVAGIMAAMPNNSFGISGITTGYVIAVKALDAQGVGTNFDIAKAIQYCADRTDVRVINLSLGGPAPSTSIHDALVYATTPTTELVTGAGAFNGFAGKGKLIVAAAGNNNSQVEIYPAGYSNDPEFATNRILSVGATGYTPLLQETDYSCRATFSNYGLWVNVAAPGLDIYSTTPWDIPFYRNYYSPGLQTRFDFDSGTSMAAAFVSAAAARRMGYKPLETSQQVGTQVVTSGDLLGITKPNCVPLEMQAVRKVNVATLLDRTAVRAPVFDAATGLPLYNGYVGVGYTDAGVAAIKYSQITAQVSNNLLGFDLDPNRLFTSYIPYTDVLDLPTKDVLGATITTYTGNVFKGGYTAGWQQAFQQDVLSNVTLTPGSISVLSDTAVPPANTGFNVVLGWQQPGFTNNVEVQDLDLYVWLPQAPGVDPGQPAGFIVGYGGDAFGYVEGDSFGTMTAFPFARLKREGGFLDNGPAIESTTISERAAHGAVPANYYLPYWAGTYTVLATDYGQTIDDDSDGCGNNYGSNFNPNYSCGGTQGVPLLGSYLTPFVYVWKDGVVQSFVDSNCTPNKHWWKALSITSPVSGILPTYTTINTCDNGAAPNFLPYVGAPNPNDRITLSGLGK